MFEPILRKLSSSFLALEVCYCYRISNWLNKYFIF
jgi:hypothetical protein